MINNKGFFVDKFIDNELYFISINVNDKSFSKDKYIMTLINIDAYRYHKLLSAYNAEIKYTRSGYVFQDRNDAQNIAKYLNETYLVALKLQGAI